MAFGDENNYRLEPLTFEVVPFKSAYHAIFGRPAFAAFHARSCYIYSKLKMPGPNGIITIDGNFDKVDACEAGEAAFAESVLGAQELQQAQKDLDPTEMPPTKKQISEPTVAFKPAEETKDVPLVEGDASKKVTIGADLDPKYHQLPRVPPVGPDSKNEAPAGK